MVGLSLTEIYSMEIWELNLYIKAKTDREVKEYKRDMALAYNIGAFTSSMHPMVKKRPKELSYYLDSIDSKTNKKTKEEINKGIEFAKKMAKERRKYGRSNT